MNLSVASVKRPVTTLMCVLVAISFGLMSLMNMGLDMLPNMNIPVVLVMTSYDGASSEEIKNLVTEPMEKAVASVSGLDTLQSTSSAGSSIVAAQFDFSVDVDVAAQDVRERVDMYKAMLPEDASDPTVMKLDITSMTGNIMVSATSDKRDINDLKEMMDDLIVPRIERQNGVASVTMIGGDEKIIEVALNQEKMRAYGISESTVTGLLASENINTPLGSVYQGDKNLTLRIKGEYRDITEIKDVVIPTGTGGSVFLSDIATVTEKYDENRGFSYTNNKESIFMAISKNSTANTVNVADAVFDEIEKIQEDYPEIEFTTIFDPSDYIKTSLSSVGTSALQGGIFAVIVLFLFLREIRSTLVVAVSMPVSIITTFAVMKLMNVNFNLMSLGGLTLGIGMLVDNSIVVMESIFVKLEQGKDRITAAKEGGTEVINSVLASTLTTVAVFLPITMVGGTVAELFNDLCLTIVFSLLSSLVVSVTFVPMACSVLLTPDVVEPKKSKGPIGWVLDLVGGVITALEKGYDKLIHVVLNNKKATVAVAIAFVVITGMVIPNMNTEFMSSTDESSVSIDISLPKGTTIDKTEDISWKVIHAIEDIEEIKDISARAGGDSASSAIMGSSEDSASITISLYKKGDKEHPRKRSTAEVGEEMRDRVKNIAGADITVSYSGNSMGSYSSGDFEVVLYSDDSEQLQKTSDRILNIVKGFEGITDVESSVEDRSPNATIRIDKRKANNLGINVASISSLLRTDITGTAPTTFKIDGEEYDIKVVLEDGKVDYLTDVEELLIPTGTGSAVPLSEISEIVDEDVPVSISREDQTDYVSITGALESGYAVSQLQQQFEAAMQSFNMPSTVTWKYGGSTEDMATAFSGLAIALIVALFLVYMIMAAEFEAFSFPFIVMFSIPIAITGGLFGTFIYGQNISVTTLLGLIMLAGVVINNAIVLIDYANLRMREEGLSYKEAMLAAGPLRLRPILMSTLTTVLGMLPMMISQADGSESMRGLAVAVVFGLSFSTLVTLLLIPAIYVAFNERIDKRRKKREARKAAKAARRR